ncbi:type VI secretion system lipoprotein TssJ [Parendozoicomonas sp. Alg238-R29]|uniref:type VI secretion system lipoprotein TssJ n=1 Tax=Parendozoicomonas sp. Alg238-R29 TaxID=2993446 RepID=UPI00248F3455|nr:type VI secretion system lipoprotein TssJ [Parendozoicomonas sp. Alg238-R29]
MNLPGLYFTRLWLCIPVLYLAGCSWFGGDSNNKDSQPALAGIIKLTVRGADYLNPDTYGRPCPVVLRLYELPDCSVFGQYRFLDLYNQADHFLGAQLLYTRELAPLHPGQTLTLDIPLVKGAGCIAALAGYSQYREGSPSATLPIMQSANVQLTVEGLRVVLTEGYR